MAKLLKHLNQQICKFNNKTNNVTAETGIYLIWRISRPISHST